MIIYNKNNRKVVVGLTKLFLLFLLINHEKRGLDRDKDFIL